jgi:hypothetical protein
MNAFLKKKLVAFTAWFAGIYASFNLFEELVPENFFLISFFTEAALSLVEVGGAFILLGLLLAIRRLHQI